MNAVSIVVSVLQEANAVIHTHTQSIERYFHGLNFRGFLSVFLVVSRFRFFFGRFLESF